MNAPVDGRVGTQEIDGQYTEHAVSLIAVSHWLHSSAAFNDLLLYTQTGHGLSSSSFVQTCAAAVCSQDFMAY